MEIKYTNAFLHHLEDIFTESDYILRYAKGKFKSGYCLMNNDKIVLLNSFYPLEGKINSLIEILKVVNLNTQTFRPKTLKLYQTIRSMPTIPTAPADSEPKTISL